MKETQIEVSIIITTGDGNKAVFRDSKHIPAEVQPHNAQVWVQTLTGLESTLSKVHATLFPDEAAALNAPTSAKP